MHHFYLIHRSSYYIGISKEDVLDFSKPLGTVITGQDGNNFIWFQGMSAHLVKKLYDNTFFIVDNEGKLVEYDEFVKIMGGCKHQFVSEA